MRRIEDYPWLWYKYWLPVFSRKWELEGEIDAAFIRDHGSEVSDRWNLLDPVGNSHIVYYNMNPARPRLTYGWYQLRDFYHLEGDCLFILNYVRDSLFHIEVKDHERREVVYMAFGDPSNRGVGYRQLGQEPASPVVVEEPEIQDLLDVDDFIDEAELEVAPPNEVAQEVPAAVAEDPQVPEIDGVEVPDIEGPDVPEVDLENGEVLEVPPIGMIFGPDDMYECIFTHTLTYCQATRSMMHVPSFVGEYLRGAGVNSWNFVGPEGVEVECRIIKPGNANYVKIGQGWRNFCQFNNILPNQELTFRFTNPHDRIVHVD